MAEWWDWSSVSADRDEAVRQSAAQQHYDRMVAEYNKAVDDARSALSGRPGGSFWDAPLPRHYRSLPAETRMVAMRDAGLLTPKNPAPGYAKFLGESIRYPLEFFARPRDTAVRAAQELSQGNVLSALGHAAAAPASAFVPAVAAGRAGDQDDWREAGRRMGVSERDLMLLDVGTDAGTYLSFGAVPAVRHAAVQGLSRADDLLRALRGYAGKMRYGAGAPAYLEDAAGNVLTRLPSAASAPAGRLSLPAQ